ncbi:hypothetical protein, partial [Saccharicrinis aurantiacus]|uniref:hypothetical protein n=1 Tax=Saccharicrinis aurantiacus TaxID=1849719 RepID=UPI0015C52BDC
SGVGSTSHIKFSLSQSISDQLGLLKNRTPDNFWIYANNDKLIIVDVKVGSSFDKDQLLDYGKIMDALVQFKSEKGKALSQFLESKNIPASALDNVEFRYIVLDGGKGDVATQAAKIQKAVKGSNLITDKAKQRIKVVTE